VGIAAVRQLDFDHVAAEVAEQTARVGAGYMAADVDATETFKCSGNHARLESSTMTLHLSQSK
jgi:hypothetical protein